MSIWDASADKFRGRLYLLVIDKVIIAAIVGFAIVGYDRFRTLESRQYEATAEQAQLVREFLPAIVEDDGPALARLYMLRAAVRTGAVDADAAVHLGRSLFEGSVPGTDYRRVMTEFLPSGLLSVAGLPTAIPGAYSPERQLWRSMFLDAVPAIEASGPHAVESTDGLHATFYGLFLLSLGGTPEADVANDLSRSASRGLGLIGSVLTLLSNGDEPRAIARVERELFPRQSSLSHLRLRQDVLRALSWRERHSCGRIAEPVARVLVEPRLRSRASLREQVAHRELRLRAVEVLAIMGNQPNLSLREPPECILTAIPILVEYVGEFLTAARAHREGAEWLTEGRYGREWPELIGQTVARILACHPSSQAQDATRSFRAIGNERLRTLHPLLMVEPGC